MKNPWVVIGIVIIVLFGGAIWHSRVASEKSNEGVEVMAHIKGNPDATVTLTEYSDFECPACAAFQPALTEILDTYGDRLQFEYKHFPLHLANPAMHPHSVDAALAAEAAGQQGEFFAYHDVLFARQEEWAAAAVPITYFIQYASDLGLDLDQFKSHLKSSVLRERVQSDFRAGKELNITGTPSFFLNGQKMQFETFEAFIGQVAAAVDPDSASSTSAVPNGVKFGI